MLALHGVYGVLGRIVLQIYKGKMDELMGDLWKSIGTGRKCSNWCMCCFHIHFVVSFSNVINFVWGGRGMRRHKKSSYSLGWGGVRN